MFGVPFPVLQRRVSSGMDISAHAGRAVVLGKDLEGKIVRHCLDMHNRGFGLSLQALRNYALCVAKPLFPDFKASDEWASSFLKRHELSVRVVCLHFKSFDVA
jgi:hypothetical protein